MPSLRIIRLRSSVGNRRARPFAFAQGDTRRQATQGGRPYHTRLRFSQHWVGDGDTSRWLGDPHVFASRFVAIVALVALVAGAAGQHRFPLSITDGEGERRVRLSVALPGLAGYCFVASSEGTGPDETVGVTARLLSRTTEKKIAITQMHAEA